MNSEQDQQRAIKELDRKTIGSRWIGLSPAEVRKRIDGD
jgi:hypothetical protein